MPNPSQESSSSFGPRIVNWFQEFGRDLPWRDTFDPYHIWIAEVVLQQTRIEQGVGYYYRFVERFPDVQSLATASQDEVLKYWEGLGYYSRARNLHAGAQQMMDEFSGSFPTDYREWLKVKGVGPYTARAIGSFAFGNPTGVIDGNVLRVMSRVLADERPVDDPKTRKALQVEIDQWVAPVDSRPFNHGIMDIGATICTPTKPGCLLCPLMDVCEGYRLGMTHLLPRKRPKKARPVRYFHFYLIRSEADEILVRRRPEKGLWGGLWEIPNSEVDLAVYQARDSAHGGTPAMRLKHSFTHFDMQIQVFVQEGAEAGTLPEGQFIDREKIATFAFSRAVNRIFEKLL